MHSESEESRKAFLELYRKQIELNNDFPPMKSGSKIVFDSFRKGNIT